MHFSGREISFLIKTESSFNQDLVTHFKVKTQPGA